jgi:serine/threonine-protein kinase HipA
MLGLVEQVEAALTAVESVLPHDFPARTWGAVSSGMRAQVLRFRDGLLELGQKAS